MTFWEEHQFSNVKLKAQNRKDFWATSPRALSTIRSLLVNGFSSITSILISNNTDYYREARLQVSSMWLMSSIQSFIQSKAVVLLSSVSCHSHGLQWTVAMFLWSMVGVIYLFGLAETQMSKRKCSVPRYASSNFRRSHEILVKIICLLNGS